jgi:non-specific serine/threonine protein kinase
MPESKRKTPPRIADQHPQIAESGFRALFAKLKKRRIVETLAAFIGGGWLLVEVVERLLVEHYKFPKESIDLTVVSVIGALLATLVWRWYRTTEKRPGNIKVEVLLVPLIILAALSIDLMILLENLGISGKTLLIAAVAVGLGIAWIILKSLQWAAAVPVSSSGLIQKPTEPSSPASGPPEKSIVVLPFSDLSPQKDQEYFCDGMTEEIITDLSHVHALRVISRNSAMMLKGTPKDTGTIGRELNVQYVLEGSLRKAGNDLKITAQLIDAFNDAHLWAEKYSGTLDDVFAIQEKVSRSIVDALKLKLTPEERQGIIARPIDNVAAYDLHIRARHEMSRETEVGLEQALQLIKKGLEIIGENEIFLADEGQIYCLYMDWGIKKEQNLFVKAEECIQKVFALNPASAYGHFLRGMIRRKKGATQEAVREFKLSLTIDPNHPDSMAWLSWVYAHSGKVVAARPLISRLLEIDPLTPINYFWAGAVELMDGKFELGIEEFNKGHQLDKGNPAIRYSIAIGLAYARRYEEAYKLFDQIEQEFSKTVWARLGLFSKFSLQNKKSEALQTVTEELKSLVKGEEMYTIFMAESYALINEKNEAIDWIENGVKSGFINYPFLIEYDPFLANIRSEPRFQKLMERVKKEREVFEV